MIASRLVLVGLLILAASAAAAETVRVVDGDTLMLGETTIRLFGLSVPACSHRIRRLRTEGAIEREIATVRPTALGWSLSMIVLVILEREGARTIQEMMRKLQVDRRWPEHGTSPATSTSRS